MLSYIGWTWPASEIASCSAVICAHEGTDQDVAK
jgi:hypothetical protein